jgi:hypothetical protein
MQKYQDSSLEETLSRDDFSSVEEPMREMCVLAGGGGGRNAVLLVCVWLTRAPACRYAMALIQVVYTLHQAGWVHNDLKVGSGLDGRVCVCVCVCLCLCLCFCVFGWATDVSCVWSDVSVALCAWP